MSLLYIVLGIIIVFAVFKFVSVWAGAAIVAVLALYGVYHFMPSYYTMKGNKAYAGGDEETCRMWYKKAYDTGRTKVETKTLYAYILLRTGHEDEAEEVLNPIIRVKGLAPEKKNLAKQQRCMVYYRQGKLKEALEEATELYDNGYKTTNLYGMIGYFKLLNDEPLEETTALCEEAYEYNSDSRDILDNLSICYYRAGRYEDAERVSDELMKNNKDFIEGCYHGAQIAVKRGKNNKAKEYLEQIDECTRSIMTTITEEEIKNLKQEVNVHDENTAS